MKVKSEMLSVYKLNEHAKMTMGMGDDMERHYDSTIDRNEQIISLRDGFGKY